VDSHLDLAENVTLFGRDLTLRAAEIRALEKRTAKQATVSLPELEQGGIATAFATVTAGFLARDVGETFEPRSAIYHTSEEAEAQALTQIRLYERWEEQGRVRLLRSVTTWMITCTYGSTIANSASFCSWKVRTRSSTYVTYLNGGSAVYA